MAMRYYAPFPGGGGDPARPRGPHALRIGDAERDAAATDLGEHYAAGRLTLDELHERLDAVFSAKTFGQLTRIMADLPGPGRLAWRTAGHGAVPHAGWDPAVFPYAHLGMAGTPWPAAGLPDAGRQARELAGAAYPRRPGGPVRRAFPAADRHADLAVHRPAVRQARLLPPGGPGFQRSSTLQYVPARAANGPWPERPGQNGPGGP